MAELMVHEGEQVEIPFKPGTVRRVTPRMYPALVALRAALIDAARGARTVTYGEAAAAAGGAYLPRGLAPLLDVLAVDCRRRGEPRLDSLVVSSATSEVAEGFSGEAGSERRACYRHWRDR